MQKKLNKIIDCVSNEVPERDPAIKGIILALLSKSHVVLIGPPGTAKSMLIDSIVKYVQGVNKFSYLFSKFTTPEEIFGPVSLKGLEQDQFVRVVTNKLPDAHVAFCDEVFKANSAILNSMLTIMNERLYDNGTRVSVPLISMIGASNEIPQEETLCALYDRFALRYVTSYLSRDKNMTNLLLGNPKASSPAAPISLTELQQAQAECSQIQVEKSVVQSIIELRTEMSKQGFSVSDRRWIQSMSLLKACAYLDGRDKIESDDLSIYGNMLWDKPEDKRKVTSLINKFVNPDYEKLLEISDALDEQIKKFESSSGDRETAGIQLAATVRKLQQEAIKMKAGKKGEDLKADMEKRFQTTIQKVYNLGFSEKK